MAAAAAAAAATLVIATTIETQDIAMALVQYPRYRPPLPPPQAAFH